MEAKKKISKRDAIIEAAIAVFSHKGYHNTRMEEIAVAAGAGKGTIYEYFASKLELFHEILLTGWRKFQEDIPIEEMETLPISEQLLHILNGHLRYFQENRQLTRVSFCEAETIDQELMAWTIKVKEEKEKQVQSLIEKGIARGELRNDLDVIITSRMVCALIPYFASHIVMTEAELDTWQMASQMSTAIIHGIKK